MNEHADHLKRIVTDIWEPGSKVREEDLELLMLHLRSSFSDQHSLMEALKVDQRGLDQKLGELQHRKELVIDHNLEPE